MIWLPDRLRLTCPHRVVSCAHRWAEGISGEPGQDVASVRAATMLPAQLLQPGETITLLLKPSPWYILLAPLKSITVLVILTLAVLLINGFGNSGFTNRELALLGIVLIGLRLFWQFAEWLSRVYVLTDQRVLRIKGVLKVSVFECQLHQIQQTDLVFTLRERFIGLGTIGFSTAGTASTDTFWLMVAQPLEVHQQVIASIKRYRP